MENLTNLTVRVRPEVAEALGRLALEAGQEGADYAATVLSEHAAAALSNAAVAASVRAEGVLKRAAADLARRMSPPGSFDPDVTLRVFQEIRQNDRLSALYRDTVGEGGGAKARINRTLGSICKVASGGSSRGPGGEVVTIQVTGEFCRTYTRLFPPD